LTSLSSAKLLATPTDSKAASTPMDTRLKQLLFCFDFAMTIDSPVDQ
jgi:hypothetical protein